MYDFIKPSRETIVDMNTFRDLLKRAEEHSKKIGFTKTIEEFKSRNPRIIDVKIVSPTKVFVKDEETQVLKDGYLHPSLFNPYRKCARRLAIEVYMKLKQGGYIVTRQALRSLVKGWLFHEYYSAMMAVGETEVKVTSEKEKISGRIDELREVDGFTYVVEVKSSWGQDLVAGALQVMAYMYAISDERGIPLSELRGFLVTPKGVYEIYPDRVIFDEYRRRVEKIVSIAREGKLNLLPPVLPKHLRGKCEKCPYRSECRRLPVGAKTYDEYFDIMGFSKLSPVGEKRRVNLTNWFKVGST